MLHTTRGTLVISALLLTALSSCSATPQQPVSAQDTEATPEQPSSAAADTIATGELIAIDGEHISGHVLVTISDPAAGAAPTEPHATVTFSDFSIPYEYVTVGGILATEAQTSCFDTGLRVGGGQITPDSQGTAETLMPTMLQGQRTQEIVLYLDHTQVHNSADCLQPVVARAALSWHTH